MSEVAAQHPRKGGRADARSVDDAEVRGNLLCVAVCAVGVTKVCDDRTIGNCKLGPAKCHELKEE